MKKNFGNLSAALSIFTDQYDLSLDQNLASLDRSIIQGLIDAEKLEEELSLALENLHFDWVNIARETDLITYNLEDWSNSRIREHVKGLLWKFFSRPNS